MRLLSTRQAYRILELPEDASSRQVQAAFRRLAKRYHPDVCRTIADHRPFARVVDAYRVLCHRLGARPRDSREGDCPRCGAQSHLFHLLDGRSGCADCLLGCTHRKHLLRGPVCEVARHGVVVALCGLGLGLLFRYVRTEELLTAALAASAVGLAFLLLAAQVLRISLQHRRRRRSARRTTTRHRASRSGACPA